MAAEISVWGDSLMQGVLYDGKRYIINSGIKKRVEETLNITVNNYSRFGLTTSKAAGLFEKAAEKDGSGTVIFEFGGNDCNYDWKAVNQNPLYPHLPATPINDFINNYEKMIGLAQSSGKRVILTTLPPLNERAFFDFITRDGISRENILLFLGDVGHIYRHHERYNAAVVMLARKHGLPLIDIRDAFLRDKNCPSLMCEDGIHPCLRGQEVMYGAFIDFHNNIN